MEKCGKLLKPKVVFRFIICNKYIRFIYRLYTNMDKFKIKWNNVQQENNRYKWLQNREEFTKKFGTANTVIIEYAPIDDLRYFERWNVKVTYDLFGIFPLSTITFGTHLSRQEVENLKVPFAKISYVYKKK